MPVYAPTSGFADQRRHPRALFFIVGGHALLIAAVMTAKMEAVRPFVPTITDIELIPAPKPPPPESPPPPDPKPRTEPRESYIDRQSTIVPVPEPIDDFDFTSGPLSPDPEPAIGSGEEPHPKVIPSPIPVLAGPRFATPDWALKPPYPDDKRRLEEEAVLRLRLSIDERGRVIAVEPVGSADRSFMEAARRHLIAHWRYKPAIANGRPVPSSTLITLRFELED